MSEMNMEILRIALLVGFSAALISFGVAVYVLRRMGRKRFEEVESALERLEEHYSLGNGAGEEAALLDVHYLLDKNFRANDLARCPLLLCLSEYYTKKRNYTKALEILDNCGWQFKGNPPQVIVGAALYTADRLYERWLTLDDVKVATDTNRRSISNVVRYFKEHLDIEFPSRGRRKK